MLVIPAVDVRGGNLVRLRQGDYGRETVFDDDPFEYALSCIDCGATRLHLVDLDAARGRPDLASHDALRDIVAALHRQRCEVEVGGGVRTRDAALAWLDAGATFVVLGSVAVLDPVSARAICAAAPGRVLLALDVTAGRARVQGWTEDGDSADSVLASWNEWPAAGVIYTNTERDGMLAGPDLEGFDRCRAVFGGPVYLSGGMRDVGDAVASAAHGAAGVVVGRALLDGSFDLAAAIDAVAVAP